MEVINIKVRKEVIRCKKCHVPKEFLYLSDFSYGQRLVFINGETEYAFINLIEDGVYDEFKDMVIEILNEEKSEVSEERTNEIVNLTFGVACDCINGYAVDFNKNQKQCAKCGSVEFERNMIEPESLVEIQAYPITHTSWKSKNESEKKEMLRKKIKSLS